MRRLLRHTLLALSLLLCAAVAGMWVRSYWYADYLFYIIPEKCDPSGRVTKASASYGVLQRRGVLQLEWCMDTYVSGPFPMESTRREDSGWRGVSAGHWTWGKVNLTDEGGEVRLQMLTAVISSGYIRWREPERSFLQFGYAKLLYPFSVGWPSYTPGVCRVLTIPHWAIGLPGLILPGLTLSNAWRRRRRRVRGLCPDCGYDLRATPARCPECGREAAGSAAAR